MVLLLRWPRCSGYVSRPDRPLASSSLEDAGRKLAELASRGILARGLRAVLTHHLLFLFNRHGVSAADQHTLAAAARRAVFGAPDDMPRNRGTRPADTATVCPVTTTASLNDEDRAR